MHSIMKNVIGMKLGRLTILERAGKNKHNQQLLFCLCDCGQKTVVTYSNLFRTGKKRTTSCGCYSREQHASKQTWEVEFRRFERMSAGRRSLEFVLTIEEFKTLCVGECFYCGGAPKIKTHVGNEIRNSINRLDPSIGYHKSNCVSCCATCQFMKGSLTCTEFLEQIKIISSKLDTY